MHVCLATHEHAHDQAAVCTYVALKYWFSRAMNEAKALKQLIKEEGLTQTQAEFCLKMAKMKNPTRKDSDRTLWPLLLQLSWPVLILLAILRILLNMSPPCMCSCLLAAGHVKPC